MSATLFQPEPSAKAPCTRTTFLICCFMIIFLSSLSFSDSCIEPRTCDHHSQHELSTIENTNHFCRFLLKMRRKGGRKTTPGSSSTRELLTGSQIRDDIASSDDSEQHRPGPLSFRMGSIRVVEEIGVWVLREFSASVRDAM